MAVLTVAAFISKWGTTNFPSTGLRAITGAKMREFKDDIADSFQSVLGAVTITSWKSPCVVATTANITLSGEQTIDGVLTSASRVLVKNQTTTSQNGIYVSAAGAWSRSTDADAAGELEGAAVGVTQGTTQQNTIWIQTTDNITLGTSAIAWQQSGYGSGVTLIDDDTFATASATTAPSSESVKAYVDTYVDAKILTIETSVSSAEILALNSTQKILISAPGAGKIIEVIAATMFYDYNSIAYGGAGASAIFLSYNAIGGELHSAGLSITSLVDVYQKVSLNSQQAYNAAVRVNTPLVMSASTSNPTSGNGTAKWFITYRIITV